MKLYFRLSLLAIVFVIFNLGKRNGDAEDLNSAVLCLQHRNHVRHAPTRQIKVHDVVTLLVLANQC